MKKRIYRNSIYVMLVCCFCGSAVKRKKVDFNGGRPDQTGLVQQSLRRKWLWTGNHTLQPSGE